MSMAMQAMIQPEATNTEMSEYGPSIIRESPTSIKTLLKNHSFGVTFFSLLRMYSMIRRQISKKTSDMKM